jgi:hypothetical protein
MTRRFPGLHETSAPAELPDGIYLVRVERVNYRWHAQKPYYSVRFAVLEPKPWAGAPLTGRLYCTEKALWKLSWFLRDFGYNAELLGRDELNEKALVKLHGIVKASHRIVNGTFLLNLDGFAPAAQWEELPAGLPTEGAGSEIAQ